MLDTTVQAGLVGGGLVFFGYATGINPVLLAAGAIGCWSALMLKESDLSRFKRGFLVSVGGLMATWGAPMVWAGATAWESFPAALRDKEVVFSFPISFVIGILSTGLIKLCLGSFEKKAKELTQ